MSSRVIIASFEFECYRYKQYAEAAMEQVSVMDLHTQINPRQNSIAIIMRHMAGNMISRFTDFLVSDGEKPTRDREAEFAQRGLTRDQLMALWAQGWHCVFGAIAPLTDEHLGWIVTIRGEAHTVALAIARQVAHYAWHTGQIALIGKHLVGDRWGYLTIPPSTSGVSPTSGGG